MTRPFDSFVVFAEMRTGSNFLEASLNDLDGVACLGEAFNPTFVGHQGCDDLLGVTLPQREADPIDLLARIRSQPGLAGFRFFHDHDRRIFDAVMPDPRVAKIVLTRNPVESYISRKIAAQTGQWKLTNVRHLRSAQVAFDGAEFAEHVADLQAFQVEILRGLQVTGQTAFWIAYEDLADVDVLNGLAAFLGVGARLSAPNGKLKKQNPEPVPDKVTNPEDLSRAIAALDRFNLTRTPNFEPRRGPGLPGFTAAAQAPLLFLPIACGPRRSVLTWLAALDGVQVDGLQRNFTQPGLRQWQAAHPGHRSFAVLRHPLARAHAAFCDCILSGRFDRLRDRLVKLHEIPLPPADDLSGYGPAEHRAAFAGFLQFLKANLAGQTSVRVDQAWASQGALLRGIAQAVVPDVVLREDRLDDGLERLAAELGLDSPPHAAEPADTPFTLDRIADPGLEALARDAYRRDYEEFGFGPWTG